MIFILVCEREVGGVLLVHLESEKNKGREVSHHPNIHNVHEFECELQASLYIVTQSNMRMVSKESDHNEDCFEDKAHVASLKVAF